MARAGTKLSNLQRELEVKILASSRTSQVTVVLGDEFDDPLRVKLMDVLRQLGAVQRGSTDRAVAGSQDLEYFEVEIDGRTLFVEAETYIGLSVTGPEDLVQKVRALVST